MKGTITGILIDPYTKTVEPVGVSVGRGFALRDIYRHLKCDTLDYMPQLQFGRTLNNVYVDPDGLYKKDQAFFALPIYKYPVAGYGLILGEALEDAGIQSASIPLEIIRKYVSWPDVVFAGTGDEEHDIRVFGGPIFRPRRLS